MTRVPHRSKISIKGWKPEGGSKHLTRQFLSFNLKFMLILHSWRLSLSLCGGGEGGWRAIIMSNQTLFKVVVVVAVVAGGNILHYYHDIWEKFLYFVIFGQSGSSCPYKSLCLFVPCPSRVRLS